MKKIIFFVIIIMIATIELSAQQKVNIMLGTGRSCFLVQVGGIATMDKEPITAKAKYDIGGAARFIYYRNGISYIAEGRYQTGRSAALAGISIDVIKNKRLTPSFEVMFGGGEQLLGYGYSATVSGNTDGKLKQTSYYKKFKFQAETAVNLEYRISDLTSVILSGGVIYRSSEGNKSKLDSNIEIGDSNVTEGSKALDFMTKKIIPKVSISLRFRIF